MEAEPDLGGNPFSGVCEGTGSREAQFPDRGNGIRSRRRSFLEWWPWRCRGTEACGRRRRKQRTDLQVLSFPIKISPENNNILSDKQAIPPG
jgi:hypothetical protein